MTSSSKLNDCGHPWPGVDVRHLVTLNAVAWTRSFGGAAAELGYVQSAVSQHIADLERVVGTRLVDRSSGHRSVLLTRSGELLLEHARVILTELQAARADFSAHDSTGTAVVRAGLCQGVAPALLPRFLPAVKRGLPDVRLDFMEVVGDDDLPALVECGEIDVALGPLPPGDGRFESVSLCRDPFVLVVAADSPLARPGTPPSPAELAELSLILPMPSRAFAHVEAQLKAHGIKVASTARSATAATTRALVAAGLGAAILPRLAVGAGDPATAVVSLESFVLPRMLMLYWRARRPKAQLIERLGAAVLGSLRAPGDDVAEIAGAARAATG